MSGRAIRGALRLASALGLLISGCAPAAALPLIVGATPAAESVLLAQLYAGALRGAGAPVRVQTVDDRFAALDSGAVTVAPGLTGQVLAAFAPDAVTRGRSARRIYQTMVGVLPEGIAAGDYAMAAEDKPALAVTAATASAWRSATLPAAVRHCAELSVGAVAGTAPPRTVDQCDLSSVRRFADDAALFAALRAGRLVAAWTSTADPAVPDDVVVLADDKPGLIRAENVVPLYRYNELTEPQLLALNQVAGVLDTEALVEMRRRVADGEDPQAVVEAWLSEHPLGR